jgi:hypothetical protein
MSIERKKRYLALWSLPLSLSLTVSTD